MKQSSWGFRKALVCCMLVNMWLNVVHAGENEDGSCEPQIHLRYSETHLSDSAKIAGNVRSLMERGGNDFFEVMIVLDVPKPNLSHVLGGKSVPIGRRDIVDRDAAIDTASEAVAEILARTSSEELRRFRNAASILAKVDTATINQLAASEHVLEIVENQNLRKQVEE